MGRKAVGSVKFARGKYIARLRGEYLGSWDTEERALQAIEAAKRIDSDRAPDSIRLFAERWLDQRELGGDIRGIHRERSVWAQHVATAFFYDWPLRKLRAVDVQQWLVTLSQKQAVHTVTTNEGTFKRVTDRRLARATVVNVRGLLLACLKQAVLQGKLQANPVSAVTVPRMHVVKEEGDEWTFLSAAEVRQLFKAVAQDRKAVFYTAVYAVAIYGGLRKGEIQGLRWEDLKDGEMQVRRSYAGPLKSLSSRRNVPMLRQVREALDAWRRYGGAVKARGLVFPADHGGCYATSFDASWESRWRAQTGCKPSVRFHDLRHTCASHLIMGTWGLRLDLVEVKAWLGHADIGTTQRYAHLAPGSLRSKVAAMELIKGK